MLYIMAKEINLDDITDPEKKSQAVALLEEAMLFWRGEGQKLIKQLIKAVEDKEIRLAVQLAKTWKGVDDRWIDIAAKIAPYQTAKLSSIEVNKTEVKRFVIAAPPLVPNKKDWLEKVEYEQKILPKPVVITNVLKDDDDTIDEIEYEDINETYR